MFKLPGDVVQTDDIGDTPWPWGVAAPPVKKQWLGGKDKMLSTECSVDDAGVWITRPETPGNIFRGLQKG